MGGWVQGWGGGGSGRMVLIDNGRVNQSKAADALVQVKTTKFGSNVGPNMLLNISSRYFGGLIWSRQLRGLPSSDGYFSVCSHYCIIMKFAGDITNDRRDVHAKGHGQKSKVKVTGVKTQLSRFRTATPVGIHIWWWNDAQSLMLLRRDALLFFKVICETSRSHG